jgi:hypothetical protein
MRQINIHYSICWKTNDLIYKSSNESLKPPFQQQKYNLYDSSYYLLQESSNSDITGPSIINLNINHINIEQYTKDKK